MRRPLIFILFFFLSVHIYSKEPIVGICLSGGGALGYAHIGALKALEENHIHPQIICGSSMGAIIGVLYASGISPDSMLIEIKKKRMDKLSSVISFTMHGGGLSSHKALRTALSELIPYDSFDSLPKEFYACVSNISSARSVFVGKGYKNSLRDIIVASASIPFVFEPIQIEDSLYVDGGMFNNMPAQAIKNKCDILIGVDVIPQIYLDTINNSKETLIYSVRGMEHNNSSEGRSLCDYIIEPNAIKQYDEMDFDKYKEIFDNGYIITKNYIKTHPKILNLREKINQ